MRRVLEWLDETVGTRLRFWCDARGVAAVEFALILPIAAALLGLLVMGEQGLELMRKVTMTARTVTDVVSRQQGSVTASQLACILGSASAVMTPWPGSQLSIVVSEVEIGASGGTVLWSQAAFNGVPLAVGSIIPAAQFPSQFAANSYEILGQVSYIYAPLQIFYPATAITLSDGIYMAPRNNPLTGIAYSSP